MRTEVLDMLKIVSVNKSVLYVKEQQKGHLRQRVISGSHLLPSLVPKLEAGKVMEGPSG